MSVVGPELTSTTDMLVSAYGPKLTVNRLQRIRLLAVQASARNLLFENTPWWDRDREIPS